MILCTLVHTLVHTTHTLLPGRPAFYLHEKQMHNLNTDAGKHTICFLEILQPFFFFVVLFLFPSSISSPLIIEKLDFGNIYYVG